jgi:hypothetical protein
VDTIERSINLHTVRPMNLVSTTSVVAEPHEPER